MAGQKLNFQSVLVQAFHWLSPHDRAEFLGIHDALVLSTEYVDTAIEMSYFTRRGQTGNFQPSDAHNNV